MKLHIKYFASIREALGQGNEAVDSAAGTVGAGAASTGAAGASAVRRVPVGRVRTANASG